MTAVLPARPLTAQAPTVPLHAHRQHRRLQPHQLARPAPSRSWDPLTVDAECAPSHDHDLPLPQAPTPPAVEDVVMVASIVAKAVAEVLLGTRSVNQVQNWLFEDVWHVIRRRSALTQRAVGRPSGPTTVRVLRVHPCQVDSRTCEVSVVLHDGAKVRAAALRLALHRDRWRAAAIRIG